MAGDWIVWDKGLLHKPEIAAIAHQVKLDPRIVCTLCMLTWEWADSETADGMIVAVTQPSVTFALLDALVAVTGFASAMELVGWLVVDGNSVTFPKFDRHPRPNAMARSRTTSVFRAAIVTHLLVLAMVISFLPAAPASAKSRE